MFQGLTADAAKAALFEVARLCYTVESSPLYGCRPICFIHDEILLEAPLFKLHEAAKELELVMVAVYQRFTPDVRITADAHAMYRWSKKAKEVFDDDGRLVPWTDGDEDLGATPEEKVEEELPMAA
jgi:DNA polymerase I-like protein with 3'-5' exonuclease and polymerase domains